MRGRKGYSDKKERGERERDSDSDFLPQKVTNQSSDSCVSHVDVG